MIRSILLLKTSMILLAGNAYAQENLKLSSYYPPNFEVEHVTVPNIPVFESDFPSTVRITKHFTQKKTKRIFSSTCTGTLITKFHVLTAAHCIDPLEEKYQLDGIRVHYGSVDIAQQYSVDVEKVTWPEAYKPNVGEQAYDIAVLKLLESVVSEEVEIVKLASEKTLDNSNSKAARIEDIIITGYGYYSIPESKVSGVDGTCGNIERREVLSDPARLNAASLSLHKTGINVNPVITTNPPCGAPSGGCFGDSGGPLYAMVKFNKQNIDLVQIGVVSGASKKSTLDNITAGTPRWDWRQNNVCFIDGAETAYSNVAILNEFILEAVGESKSSLCFDDGEGQCK